MSYMHLQGIKKLKNKTNKTCNCRESGIPWHMHSLTDVHTLFGNPP